MSLDPARISTSSVTPRTSVPLSSNMITPSTPTFASMHTHFLQQHHQHRLAMATNVMMNGGGGGVGGGPPHVPHVPHSLAHSAGVLNTPPVTPEQHQRLVNPQHRSLISSSGSSSSSGGDTPMSRTNQYKKIMKPLLERKRRARINKCLDELKDIMTVALQAQGENVSKLEKADILELTVRHLHKLQQSQRLLLETQRNPVEEIQRFQAGYTSCAQEAASFLLQAPGVDVTVSQRLLSHLTSNLAQPFLNRLSQAGSPKSTTAPPLVSSASSDLNRNGFSSPPLGVMISSPAPVSSSSSTEFPKASPPPRPSSNPTIGHFTLSITKAPLSESGKSEDMGKMPVKPEPVRLNPNDPPPSVDGDMANSCFTMGEEAHVWIERGELLTGDTGLALLALMADPKWLMMDVPK
ncbi:hypothetical protein TCAL_08338 [Tigriopus californicus]|uniref:BHLH domain-containing protein n=1 Tax=Tigriopus californicus TaxID=6832 RepID=A0A553PN98_TIGCA|nr:hypothetical protein TCAL_08338 [Tigriopus californicus]